VNRKSAFSIVGRHYGHQPVAFVPDALVDLGAMPLVPEEGLAPDIGFAALARALDPPAVFEERRVPIPMAR